MIVRPTFRVVGYGVVVVIGLCLALALERPEAAIAVTPFAVFLAIGLTAGPPPPTDVRIGVGPERIVEGENATLVLQRGERTAVRPLLDPRLAVISDVLEDDRRTLVLRPEVWGAFDVGRVAARSTDALGLWWREDLLASKAVLRVLPSSERLDRIVEPVLLAPFVGQHASRARGDGFEFADIRSFTPGDRARSVNWRVTARRGTAFVNERHPDRVGDVVLLLDTFGSLDESRVDELDRAVRILTGLAQLYERLHDRVGLLTFGGHIRWLRPGGGRSNLTRIVDGMLDTERLLTATWDDTLRVPVGALPPRSLLVALTSLDNDTVLLTLLDLRARGFDVAVLTLDPAAEATSDASRRLDVLLRDARKRRLERFGVAVASVEDGVTSAVEEVRAWRRRLSRSRR